MSRHKRTHRAKEYLCDYCTYKGTTRAHLKRHLRIHIGSKPYKCLHCDYRCNTVENLRKHCLNSKVHPGKFVYPCKYCEYGTHTALDMQKHLFTVHSVQLDSDKHVGRYIGTYEKDEDPDELPEGSCAIPVPERKRVTKEDRALPDVTFQDQEQEQIVQVVEQVVEVVPAEQRLTVIVRGDHDQHDEVIAELEISNIEEVTDLLKVVESVQHTPVLDVGPVVEVQTDNTNTEAMSELTEQQNQHS